MNTSENIGQIAAALAKVQGEIQNPAKNKEVEVQPKKRDDGTWPPKYKFKYATFDTILEGVRPVLSKHEIAFVQVPGSNNGNVFITTRLMHSSGEWIEDTLGASSAKDLQGLGSTLSYLKRYALSAMLGITADEDDDANSADGNIAETKRETQPKPTEVKRPAPREPDPFTPAKFSKQDAIERLSHLEDALPDCDTRQAVIDVMADVTLDPVKSLFPGLWNDARAKAMARIAALAAESQSDKRSA